MASWALVHMSVLPVEVVESPSSMTVAVLGGFLCDFLLKFEESSRCPSLDQNLLEEKTVRWIRGLEPLIL